MPMIGRARLLRSWGGIMDMSMDGSPIIDKTPIGGLFLNAGWCYGGFKATPASGWCFAHLIATENRIRWRPHTDSTGLRPGTSLMKKGRGRPTEFALRTIRCAYRALFAASVSTPNSLF